MLHQQLHCLAVLQRCRTAQREDDRNTEIKALTSTRTKEFYPEKTRHRLLWMVQLLGANLGGSDFAKTLTSSC